MTLQSVSWNTTEAGPNQLFEQLKQLSVSCNNICIKVFNKIRTHHYNICGDPSWSL